MSENVGLTFLGGVKEEDGDRDNLKLILESNAYEPSSDEDFWVVVVDRVKLDVKLNTVTGPAQVPGGINKYEGDSRYLLFVGAAAQNISSCPQGEFLDFLIKNGAGQKLGQIEEEAKKDKPEYENFNYLLVSEMGDESEHLVVGHEALSFDQSTVMLNLELMPVQVEEDTLYTSIRTQA